MSKKISVDYYTLNVKVLPADNSSAERYANLIENWLQKNFKIVTKTDKNHYYSLRVLNNYDNGKIYYGVITKFVSFDKIDFVDSKTGKLLPQPIPPNVEGKINEYEFVFVPECHRFAFIKIGKIDSSIKKSGAPLSKMLEIVKIAFDSGLEVGEAAIVEIAQDEFVFDEILSSDLLSLVVKLSYTNDDIIPEGKDLIDSLMKESHVGEFFGRFKPDNTGVINTDGGMVGSILELVRQDNGTVKATIDTGEEKKTINSADYPAIRSAEAEDNSARSNTLVSTIYRNFMRRYRGNSDNEKE